jgi:hypothetical protein
VERDGVDGARVRRHAVGRAGLGELDLTTTRSRAGWRE